MTAAERWTAEHGFPYSGEFWNAEGEHLGDLLSLEPSVQLEGASVARWRFPDGSSIVASFGLWEVEMQAPLEVPQ